MDALALLAALLGAGFCGCVAGFFLCAAFQLGDDDHKNGGDDDASHGV